MVNPVRSTARAAGASTFKRTTPAGKPQSCLGGDQYKQKCVGNLLRAQRTGALTALHRSGAHFVLCNKTKKATCEGWNETPADLSKVTRGAGYRAIIPASIQCVVVDVDRGGQTSVNEVTASLGAEPLAVLPSKTKGRFHLWYKCHDADTVGNSNWRDGELRGAKGYAIIYDPAALLQAIRRDAGDKIKKADLLLLPQPGKSGGKPRVSATVKGCRNNALNDAVFLAVMNGNDEAVQDAINTARDAGLPDKELAATGARSLWSNSD